MSKIVTVNLDDIEIEISLDKIIDKEVEKRVKKELEKIGKLPAIRDDSN